MDAAIESYLSFISKANFRYEIPIYQRPYSWDEEQCSQLWDDIINVSKAEKANHFTGSVVWVNNDGIMPGGQTPLLLIDGQQRTTTLTLLLIALAEYARDNNDTASNGEPLAITFDDLISDGYLIKERKQGSDRYRIVLSQADDQTLRSMIDSLVEPSTPAVSESRRLTSNLEFFRDKVSSIADQNSIWNGLLKLKIISVRLDQGVDNPQLIFESMNSTGKSLRQADLIRNYVLMGLDIERQKVLYANYWRPIEKMLDFAGDDSVFDDFMKDYLTLRLAPTPVKARDVYVTFKRMVERGEDPAVLTTESLLSNLKRYAEFYARICLGAEKNVELKRRFDNIARLDVGVVNVLLLSFCDDYDQGEFDEAGFAKLLDVVESLLLRRAICGYPSNSLTKHFPSLVARMDSIQETGADYVEAFLALLEQEAGTTRRFPTDDEFRTCLRERDLYGTSRAFYLLSRLENSMHPKNPTDFTSGTYTIEHIMPQNALAHKCWREMLGGDADEHHAALLHNIGNLTLTAFNSELSDGSFEEKKGRMIGGFGNDVVALSLSVSSAETWNADAIKKRRDELVERACSLWEKPAVDANLVENLSRKKRQYSPQTKVTLKDLFEAGLVVAGETLKMTIKGKEVKAEITGEGKIRIYNGEEFASPSPAALRAVHLEGVGGIARNGWACWTALIDGEWRTINNLKTKYRKIMGEKDGVIGLRTTFWGGFYDHCSADEAFTQAFGNMEERLANPDNWTSLRLGTSERHLNAVIRTVGGVSEVGVRVVFDSKDCYEPFWSKRDEIASALRERGCETSWDDIAGPNKGPIVTTFVECDFRNEENWPEAFDQLARISLAYRSVFGQQPKLL